MYSTPQFPNFDQPPKSTSLDSETNRLGIVGRIAALADSRPTAPAVCGPDISLSYESLMARALELGARLQGNGVTRGDLVALCVRRSPDLVVGALAILALGAGYVALDPDQPDERLRFMLEDCAAAVVVAEPALVRKLGSGLLIVPVSGSTPAPKKMTESKKWTGHCRDISPDGVAYVVYTSGSTGKPKGVMVEHGGLLNLIDWHQRTFELTSIDRTSVIANPGFDAAVWEIWPTLCAGACLHIPPAELITDPIRLREWLVTEQITVSFLPTPLAESLLGLAWPTTTRLRYLLTGGDALRRRPPPGLPFVLVNNYGVCEATVVSTSGQIQPLASYSGAPSIGSAIDGVRLRVVDDDGRVLDAGAIGELFVCGPSVARGYLGLPQLTAEKFVTDPLDPSTRAYRTGDLVRIDEDGLVEFLGRRDDQVQIRGFRVEIGEIVGALGGHPDVQSCALVPVEYTSDPRLTMVVVLRQETGTDTEQLRHYLSQRLPEHMRPDVFVFVPELPTTANGKIDRAALRALVPAPTLDFSSETRPLSEVEATLLNMVAERLKLPHVGAEENFFLLGGHSMLGAQLIIQIEHRYGVEMTLLDLFDNPTVAQMAAEVERLVVEQIAGMSEQSILHAVDSGREVG